MAAAASACGFTPGTPAEPLDEAFWRRSAGNGPAAAARQIGYDDPQGAARLVFSEADGLSGLIVDRYGRHLSLQVTALAMASAPAAACAAAGRADRRRGDRASRRTRDQPGRRAGVPRWAILGEHARRTALRPRAWPRLCASIWPRGKRRGFISISGRTAWRRPAIAAAAACWTCSATAADSALAAAGLGGAREVLGIDASAKAVALAEANAQHNSLDNVAIRDRRRLPYHAGAAWRPASDSMPWCSIPPSSPAAAQRSTRPCGHTIGSIGWAVELLAPRRHPGHLQLFRPRQPRGFPDDAFWAWPQQTRREIQILEQRGASADHPVAVTCLEGEYLKCFICRVA